jgi:hypothetical protein
MTNGLKRAHITKEKYRMKGILLYKLVARSGLMKKV